MIHYAYYLIPTYIITSVIFFCFPKLLKKHNHKQLPIIEQAINNDKILKIAHRGGPRYTVENTLEGFRKVISCSDMLQMDVCQTKDGILVVHHDSNLKRTLDIDNDIKNYNYNDLPGFKPSIQLDFADNMTIKSNGEKIPKLQHVFQQFPNIPMNIQLKTPSESSILQFVRLIRKYNRLDNTIVGIRNYHYHKSFKSTYPEIRTFMSDYDVYRALFTYCIGLLPFMNFDDSTLQIPIYTYDFQQRKLQTSNNTFKVKIFMKMIKFINFITAPLIWHFKKRNIGTFYWVCNNEEEFIRAERSGICGIMTDVPFLLQQYLNAKSK